MLVRPTIKNTSYFGCYAGLIKELKFCFDLVDHFAPGSIDDVITTQDRYFFILKNSMPGVYATCEVVYRGDERLGNR